MIEYLGGLRLSGGDHDGSLFTVLPWQKRFIYGAFRGPGDVALSVGRGNGKSALCGGVAASVVDPAGPLHGNRREVICVAADFQQARIIFEDVLSFLGEKYDLTDRSQWRKQDSANRATLEYRQSGARIRCLASKPGGLHGARPFIALLDEPSQWDQAKADRALQAIRTGLGKVPNSKMIALGTRSSDPTHWFSKLLKTAAYSQVHAARPDDPPFQVRTLRRANPSYDHLPSLASRIQEEIADAKRDSDNLASFKSLRLNRGVSDVHLATVLSVDAWRRAEGQGPAGRSGPFVLGVDPGSGWSMTAAAAYWRSGDLDSFAIFPSIPSLLERGLSDGVGRRYVEMEERGELLTAGGRVADLTRLMSEVLIRWGRPSAIVCDRWRVRELQDACDGVRLRIPIVTRGQGYRDGGEDVRNFRAAVLGGLVRPVESLLMTSALAEGRVVSDPAGNEKLSRGSAGGRRLRARDDALSASLMCVAAGFRQWHSGVGRAGGAYLGAV
ncbi:MAG: hypothetical protein OXM88_12820 [bacterium]|nr:hypothetical protein [bacterium]